MVLDEVHYLADRSRGAVWEEVIIHLPESVRVVALSATVSNAEEFGDWLAQVRGGTEVIVDEHRPVPLWQHMLAGRRLYDLFTDDQHREVNPELVRLAHRESLRQPNRRPQRGGHRPRRTPPPYRPEIIDRLDGAGLLPAITFIFSRAGCDAAVQQCLAAGLRLTTPDEARTIEDIAARRTADIPDEDLVVLGYHDWVLALRRGIAAHHAGLLPVFKEVVEELFTAGLVKAVFATETLALGINMPARTVVLEKLDKWNGEGHAALTPGEYTQLTGRAGRRGIDVEGHAVVLWQPGMDPGAVAGLAGTRTYPLNSSFRPSYNMAVNLTGRVGRDRAAALLESSFAQFQADRGVTGLARRLRRMQEQADGLAREVTCDRGDFMEYAQLRRRLSDVERGASRSRASAQRAEARRTLTTLRRGDIIRVPTGRRAGLAVVLNPPPASGQLSPSRADGPLVLTVSGQLRQLSAADFPVPADPVDRIRVPASFSERSPKHRRDLVSAMRSKVEGRPLDPPGRRLRRPGTRTATPNGSVATPPTTTSRLPAGGVTAAVTRPPTTGTRPGRRATSPSCAAACGTTRATPAPTASSTPATPSVTSGPRRTSTTWNARSRGGGMSSPGPSSASAPCSTGSATSTATRSRRPASASPGSTRSSTCSRPSACGVACGRASTRPSWPACVSLLTYESRRQNDDDGPARMPKGPVRDVLTAMTRTWGELDQLERRNGLSFLREPDPGFVWAAYRWARGAKLEDVLDSVPGLTPGDFVRSMKQLIDLLDQIAVASRDQSGPRGPQPPARLAAPAAGETAAGETDGAGGTAGAGPARTRTATTRRERDEDGQDRDRGDGRGPVERSPKRRDVASTARAAIDALRRGVIEYSALAD